MYKSTYIRSVFFFISFLFSILTYGQNNVKERDKAWMHSIKGKLKEIQVGSRSTGFATFYFKSDKSVFSVEERGLYKTEKRTDSSFAFTANFKNDTLFRVVIRRWVSNKDRGWVIMYLNGNTIEDQDGEGVVYISEISDVIKKSHELLLKAKELIKTREPID